MYNINPLTRLSSISKRVSCVHVTIIPWSSTPPSFVCTIASTPTIKKHLTPTRRLPPLLELRKEPTLGPPALGPTSGRDDQSINTSCSQSSLQGPRFRPLYKQCVIGRTDPCNFHTHLKSTSRFEAEPSPNTDFFIKSATASFKSDWKCVDVISVHTE